MLTPLGFEVCEAENGQDGLEKARLLNPDLIITDLVMPQMDGVEMVKRLRRLPEFAQVPVLASSASVSLVNPQESLDAGCDTFIPKPIEFDALLQALETYLHLTWHYAEPTNGSAEGDNGESLEMVVPPFDEISSLYEAAQKGLIMQIQEEAQRLQQSDRAYHPFVNRVLQLSDEFEVDAILHLIEQRSLGG
jgi:hypothetical protein